MKNNKNFVFDEKIEFFVSEKLDYFLITSYHAPVEFLNTSLLWREYLGNWKKNKWKTVVDQTVKPLNLQDVEKAYVLLKSMAHRGRLMLLCALVDEAHTSGELARLTGLSPSALSQHLKKLKEAKLVQCTRQHRQMIYELRSDSVTQVIQTLRDIYCPEVHS